MNRFEERVAAAQRFASEWRRLENASDRVAKRRRYQKALKELGELRRAARTPLQTVLVKTAYQAFVIG